LVCFFSSWGNSHSINNTHASHPINTPARNPGHWWHTRPTTISIGLYYTTLTSTHLRIAPLPLDRRTCINTRPRPVPCRRLLASLRRTLLSFSRTQRHRRRTNRSLKGFSSFFSSDLCWGPKHRKLHISRGSVIVSINHHHYHATTSSLRCNHRRSAPVRISIKSSQPLNIKVPQRE
jgi:hypothetical protein